MKTLVQGSRDPEVALLQRLLNLRLSPSPSLIEDNLFGPKTATALKKFQSLNQLTQDGVAGSNSWRKLGLTTDINQPVIRFAQPTNMSCWSAAATMVMGNMSVGPGRAALSSSGGLKVEPENIQTFARGLGLNMEYPLSWTVQGLAGLLRRGPLWVAGAQPSLHAVVIGAMWGDGTPNGTAMLIYDPWPPNVGGVYPAFYGARLQQFPLMTMYVLHR
jgi:hypothetical protein